MFLIILSGFGLNDIYFLVLCTIYLYFIGCKELLLLKRHLCYALYLKHKLSKVYKCMIYANEHYLNAKFPL